MTSAGDDRDDAGRSLQAAPGEPGGAGGIGSVIAGSYDATHDEAPAHGGGLVGTEGRGCYGVPLPTSTSSRYFENEADAAL